MKLFSKKFDRSDFRNEIEHSVSPALDYPFAKEKYRRQTADMN